MQSLFAPSSMHSMHAEPLRSDSRLSSVATACCNCVAQLLLLLRLAPPCSPQELPAEWRWLSEALFACLFVSFLLWTFSPLLLPRSSFSCVLLWTRLLTVLVGECSSAGAACGRLAAGGF